MPSRPLPMMLTADQWQMPGPRPPAIKLPVRALFLHHTVTIVTADPLADARRVALEGLRRFGQMSYSVLVHPRRVIFWAQMEHRGAHTKGHNSTALGLALIGNYHLATPSDDLVYDACVALWTLREFGLLVERPTVEPHRAVVKTLCPGAYAVAKVLPELRAVAGDPAWRP